MLPQEIIATKRDGGQLDAEQIRSFITGVTDGSVSEAQAGAFLMAVLLNEMGLEERIALTRTMRDSGTVLDWSEAGLDGPVIDKHSTGGVGDRVSLVLGPAFAACGGFNPMISGRGLGHTGGTLDKMDSIPGYVSQPDLETFRRVVREVGCAIVGQTGEMAPADKRLYAIRDVTATVESLSLITASILSKKLAAGLQGLVMDVKFGSGAFMAKMADAEALAESIAHVAQGAGTPTVALLTDMNQVLGRSAGNAVEVREAIDLMAGRPVDPRFRDLTIELTAEMVLLGGLAPNIDTARIEVASAIDSGGAAEIFDRMVQALGGPGNIVERPDAYLGVAPLCREIRSEQAGIVTAIDTRAVGMAVIELGGGRIRPDDSIDHTVGLTDIVAPGEAVGAGDRPIAIIHAHDEASLERAATRLRGAITLGDAAPARAPLVARRIAPAA